MLQPQSSPRSSPVPSPRAPQMSLEADIDKPTFSPVSSSARSPQEGISTDHITSAYAPAMSTIRSPHLATTPNPLIADNYRSAATNTNNPLTLAEKFVPPPTYTPFVSSNSFTSTSPLAPSSPTSNTMAIAVADRFLDESSRIRHERPEHLEQQQQEKYFRQPSGTTNIQIIEATPVYVHSSASCMSRRVKIAAFMTLVVIIILSVLGGTVWRHDNKSDNNVTDQPEPTNTPTYSTVSPSPISSSAQIIGTTTTSAGASTPTTGPSNPWGPCKPGGCLNFSVNCDNACKANDPTYKSCYAACNGEFFCQSDCASPQKNSCFGTCTSQTLMCLQQCGN